MVVTLQLHTLRYKLHDDTIVVVAFLHYDPCLNV